MDLYKETGMTDTAADVEGQGTAGVSVDEQLLQGLPTPVVRIIRLLAQRGIPSFVDASGGPVLVPRHGHGCRGCIQGK